MKTLNPYHSLTSALVAVVFFSSCLTVNIYFPADEVKNAADEIVEETWGADSPAASQPEKEEDSKTSWFSRHLGVTPAHAEQNIDISTPAIRAIKESIRNRASQLKPHLSSGAVGIGKDGLLVVRSESSLALKDRARVRKLVSAENQDRKKLYQEIARANGFPNKAGEVQQIFAKSWIENAESGWQVQSNSGSWSSKQ